MHILILDTKNQVVENVKRYKGTINSSVLRASEVFRPAIVRNCPNVIVCRYHKHNITHRTKVKQNKRSE